MPRKADHDGLRLDEAARAGWLYYVAGNTQDEIARKLGISRQAAQRLVSLAISERLIKVRLDHPIARCMELAAALKTALRPALLRGRADRSRLDLVDARHRPGRGGRNGALAAPSEPEIIGIGTGTHDARGRRSIAGDGMSAAQVRRAGRHDQNRRLGVVLRRRHPRFRHRSRAPLSDARAGRRPLGRGARVADRLASVRSVLALVERADVTFVGVGAMGESSAMVHDGIITREEAEALRGAGAVGEITAGRSTRRTAERRIDQ